MRILDRQSYLYRVRKKKCSNANRIFNTSFMKSLKPFAHRWMRENLLRFGTAEYIKFTRGYNGSEMTERVSSTTDLPLDSRWSPCKTARQLQVQHNIINNEILSENSSYYRMNMNPTFPESFSKSVLIMSE